MSALSANRARRKQSRRRRARQTPQRPRASEIFPGLCAEDQLAEAIEKLKRMGRYKDVLLFCADQSGRLVRPRLQLAAHVRKYTGEWVRHNVGKHWTKPLVDARRYRAREG